MKDSLITLAYTVAGAFASAFFTVVYNKFFEHWMVRFFGWMPISDAATPDLRGWWDSSYISKSATKQHCVRVSQWRGKIYAESQRAPNDQKVFVFSGVLERCKSTESWYLTGTWKDVSGRKQRMGAFQLTIEVQKDGKGIKPESMAGRFIGYDGSKVVQEGLWNFQRRP